MEWNFEGINNYNYCISLSVNITDKELDNLFDEYGDATTQNVTVEYKTADGTLDNSLITVNDSNGMLRVSGPD